ncbi:MAG TPA: hypothetical protein ENO08_00360 [Candidatus Eisenbacteria bacterium]|uniref:Uncharacterized protein n=1 Tax=Eiseniibacteriota bacterium TaxID=2212470 RepID=A0A7V2ATD5_UNCEI|nr:hypothetical protein [Candidatus Eisenbacteria bacterium]
MVKTNIGSPLVFAVCLTVASVLQLIGTVRYIGRLPNDKVGVTLYIVTAILFAALAAVHYAGWAAVRKPGG